MTDLASLRMVWGEYVSGTLGRGQTPAVPVKEIPALLRKFRTFDSKCSLLMDILL
jgi:hypothetical protein